MTSASVGISILTGGAGQAAGSLVGPATDAGKGIYNCLKRKYEYIKNMGQHFMELDNEARYLYGREKDVREKINNNQVTTEKTQECATWLEDVERMTNNLEGLKTRYQKCTSASCGPFQFLTRLKLSKEIVKMTKSVVGLKNRMNLEQIFLIERRPDKVEKKFPKSVNDVPSLREHVEKLLEYLMDDRIKKIGICGMFGVGKTTILDNLNNEVEKLQIFDIVLSVTVSKDGNLHQIQKTILKRLNLKMEGIDSENEAANLISRSLESKKYLLLLDEVFSEIDLHRIGVHASHSQGKVVLATREKFICYLMETDEEIHVDRLSRNDARKLFRDAVGETVDHPHIKPIAEKVLRQCGELPQVIRAVGIHLRNKPYEDLWQNTLSKLRSPTMHALEHLDDLVNAFKVMYEELPGTLKDCWLFGASFPEDHEMYREYLIECWKVEGLIGIGETFRKTREEGHSNLRNLIEKYLLDKCVRTKYVKMPIIFRNLAHKMACQHELGLFLRSGEELENRPSLGKWTNAKVISLVNSNLDELPDRVECSTISSLFLQKNENLSAIPASFFDSMSTLKILDLCGTSIKFLPPSICNLANLKGLYLNDCSELVHLPEEIEQLQCLEILDISHTGIICLPNVIGELTCLRCLRLSFTRVKGIQNHAEANGIDVLPSEIIQRLLHLEELTIDADPEEERWIKIAPAIATAVAKLGKLSTLSFYFPSTEFLEFFTRTSISWRGDISEPDNKFRSFKIYVGSHKTTNSPPFDVYECSGRRYLQYAGGKDIPNVIKEVLTRACVFELVGHQNIRSISDFGIDGMNGLDICLIKHCVTLTNVVKGHVLETPAFPWLRELHLCMLQQFDGICQGPISGGSFARLATLTLCNCPNVIKVVSAEMAKQLRELQYLRVENCSKVTEIIEVDTEIELFPKLKMLELIMLEALVSVHTNSLFEWRDLQNIEITGCDNLVNLGLCATNAPKLRRIQCSEAWWRALLLNKEVKAHLQGFCRFI